jgi:hypothetical protein
VAAPPAHALDLGGHVRDGTVVGLNFGVGWNKVKFTAADRDGESGTEDAFSGGARVGWAKSDNVIYSLGFYGWKRSYSGITPVSVTALNFLAEISWFPRGEGFWVRGGIGGGSLDLTVRLPAGMAVGKESGWNYALGAGYEFRVSDGTALGLAYDFRYVDIGAIGGDVPEANIDSASTTSHCVSLNIHFYIM